MQRRRRKFYLGRRNDELHREGARALRPYIVKASASLTDADALKAMELYDRWAAGMAVEVNDRLVYADRLYRVTQAPRRQTGWEPDKVRRCLPSSTRPTRAHRTTPSPPRRAWSTPTACITPIRRTASSTSARGQGAGRRQGDAAVLPHELVGLYFTEVKET